MKKLLLNFGLMVSAAALLGSCSKKVDEAFLNPNASTRVPVETLLPGIIGNMVGSSSAQGSSYGTAYDGLYIGRYVNFWATNTTNYQYDRLSGATGASDLFGSIWAMHYYGMGQNLGRMIDWAAEEEKWDYVGVGYAIRAWSWYTLTMMYGEAILKQAFDPNRRVFEYDSQEEILAESRRLCHIAINYLNRTDGNVSQQNLALGDQYFNGGDVNKWKKFAYTVLARTYHLTNKPNYKTEMADSVIFYCDKAITSNADNAIATFANSGISGTSNFYGQLRNNAGLLRQTRFIADLMSGVNTMFPGAADPRAPYIIRENNNGTYKGVRLVKGTDGLSTNDQPRNFWGGLFSSTSTAATDARYIFQNGAPYPIITAAEIAFMKAEALWYKGDKAAALTAYQNGISLSFDFLTGTADYHSKVPAAMQITPAAKAAYLANPVVVPTANNLTLSHIMLQKFISQYAYGMHITWVDMRRYHYTDLDPVTGSQVYADLTLPVGSELWPDNVGKWPYRARPRYNSEFLYNIVALDQVGGRLLDYHTKEMWFSQP
ncbi:MAG: SusD/RagB family nutrient-binding outer membrane lipoprotein [Chitinophagaceae bacterium]|nr:SusD/RagB family nutrient-binding outer membrane lipoprotein [Chitinophagaceae bacterium]